MNRFVFYLLSFFITMQSLHCKHEFQLLKAWNNNVHKFWNRNVQLEPASNCSSLRDALAESISSFSSCAIEHSRPITLCESCINSYLNIIESYKNLTIFQSETRKCIDEYTHLDRLEIVDKLYKNAKDLWNKAKCYECFEIENTTLTQNPSKATIEFNVLLNNTALCINETNADATIYCALCIEEYLELNEYYDSISNVNDKIGVCMDIVDLMIVPMFIIVQCAINVVIMCNILMFKMNETRQFWSEKCCQYRKKPEYVFLASVTVVSLITILFYILTKYCTDMDAIIVHESRFGELRRGVPD